MKIASITMDKYMKCLLAPPDNPDISKLTYPVLVSPKMDGIRCLVVNGTPYTRSMKPIPNLYVSNYLSNIFEKNVIIDGELIVGNPFGNDVFNRTSSGIMSKDGNPNFTYYMFDRFYGSATSNMPYEVRLSFIKDVNEYIQKMPTVEIKYSDDIYLQEEIALAQGFEGLIIRNPHAHYKFGRATQKENIIYKFKKHMDGEAKILNFIKEQTNLNPVTINELGYVKRSTCKENLHPINKIGSLYVEDITSGVRFNIGTGWNDKLGLDMYNNTNKYSNLIVKYKCFAYTPDGKPRFPVFVGFRDIKDL